MYNCARLRNYTSTSIINKVLLCSHCDNFDFVQIIVLPHCVTQSDILFIVHYNSMRLTVKNKDIIPRKLESGESGLDMPKILLRASRLTSVKYWL